MSLAQLQGKFLNKLEEKAAGGVTLPRLLRKQFQNVDLDNDGMVTIREWATIVEKTGGAISADEAVALFEYWDTAGYQREPQGLVVIADAIASLMSSELTSDAIFGQSEAQRPPSSRSQTKNNQPSNEGGIFGGGVYEAEANRFPMRQAPPVHAPIEQAMPTNAPRGNQSSIEGGIFGSAPVEPAFRPKGNTSNKSSLSGGIFGSDENAAPAPVRNKRNANASSIPGGIFG